MGLSREYRVIDSERAANRHSKGVSWLTMRPLIACYGRVPVMPLPAAANDVHRDEAGTASSSMATPMTATLAPVLDRPLPLSLGLPAEGLSPSSGLPVSPLGQRGSGGLQRRERAGDLRLGGVLVLQHGLGVIERAANTFHESAV